MKKTKKYKKISNDSANLESETQDLIKQTTALFCDENQISISTFKIDNEDVSVFFIESLVDKKLLSSNIFSPLDKLLKNEKNQNNSSENQQNLNIQKSNNSEQNSKEDLAQKLKSEVISSASIEETKELSKIENGIFDGSAVIVLKNSALIVPIFGAESRAIEEPPNTRVIKGPREGFIENLQTNIGLVRKRLKTTNLKIVELSVGKQTRTKISLLYLEDIAKPEVVKIVKKKLNAINIDAIIDSFYIESFLENDQIKLFRRVGNTEKPDVFCAKILEGRVGILVDGSPIALTVPFMLFEDLQTAADYYTIPALVTFTRVLRIIGLIFALLIPGIYVALQSYNYRILPINFLITLLSSIEGLSVPPLIEILLVLFLFEIITEASLSMPNSLGMALSIIGALALGNTAVDAGIISPPSIVVVAVSSVSLYIIPDEISETRLLRVLFTAIGGIAGLYGVVTGFIILLAYLCSITSFGVPYLAPFAPSVPKDKQDGFIKHSVGDMTTRPKLIAGKNQTRLKKNDKILNQRLADVTEYSDKKQNKKTQK